MNSINDNFENQYCDYCLVCQNLFTECLICDNALFAKVVQNCNTYLRSASIENDFKDRFNLLSLSSEVQPPSICRSCFESSLQLNELIYQLELLQKSVGDFLLKFSTKILRGPTTGNNERPQRPHDDENIWQYCNVLSESDLKVEVENEDVDGDLQLINGVNQNTIKIEHYEAKNIAESDFILHPSEEFTLSTSKASNFKEDNSDTSVVVNENIKSLCTTNNEHLFSKELRVTLERLELSLIGNIRSIPSPGDSDLRKCLADSSKLQTQSDAKKVPVNYRTGITRCSCSVCGKCFSSKNKCTIHLRTHNQGKKISKCTSNALHLSRSKDIMGHKRIAKTKKGKKCPLCPRVFIQNERLVKHIQIHTSDKSYKCPSCTMAFPLKHLLTKHMICTHQDELHRCSICKKAFRNKLNWILHEQAHVPDKPFKCSICPASYAVKTALNYHFTTHTGEKLYKCSSCSRAFARRCILQEHMRIHTGEKPHKCPYCAKAFSKKFNLTIHIRTHK